MGATGFHAGFRFRTRLTRHPSKPLHLSCFLDLGIFHDAHAIHPLSAETFGRRGLLSGNGEKRSEYVIEYEVFPKNHMISKSACKAPVCLSV